MEELARCEADYCNNKVKICDLIKLEKDYPKWNRYHGRRYCSSKCMNEDLQRSRRVYKCNNCKKALSFEEKAPREYRHEYTDFYCDEKCRREKMCPVCIRDPYQTREVYLRNHYYSDYVTHESKMDAKRQVEEYDDSGDKKCIDCYIEGKKTKFICNECKKIRYVEEGIFIIKERNICSRCKYRFE
jgi:hypothetical protein